MDDLFKVMIGKSIVNIIKGLMSSSQRNQNLIDKRAKEAFSTSPPKPFLTTTT